MATNNAINLKDSGIVSYDGAGVFSALANPLTVPNGGTGVGSFTAYSVICGGTTSTASLQNVSGVGTSGQILTSNGPGALPTWATFSGASSGHIAMLISKQSANPADSSTYYQTYADTTFTSATTETSAVSKYVMPASGTINTLIGAILVGGTLASAQNVTIALRKNETTDTNLSTTFQFTSATNAMNFTSIGLSVAAGDTITIKIVTPAWGTNPTTVSIAGTLVLDI